MITKRLGKSTLALYLFPLLLGSAKASEFTPIECPGGGYTEPLRINNSGDVVGNCQVGGNNRGFVRFANGVIKTFVVPGAFQGTGAADISDAKEIVGYYSNSISFTGGFTLIGDVFTTFSVPGSMATRPTAINASGVVVGIYLDSNNDTPAFIRDAQGNITTFEAAPSAYSTTPSGINSSGEICGYEIDSTGTHGFLRDATGNITIFDVPGSDPINGSYPNAINAGGVVVGSFYGSVGGSQGFMRDALGNFTDIYAPDGTETTPVSINDLGDIAGSGETLHLELFGFVQYSSGTVEFEDPVAYVDYGTNVASINTSGAVVGFYLDRVNEAHGYLYNSMPPPNN
jgi:uncharacterized membrane protein